MKTNTQTTTAPNLCQSCKAPVSGEVWCRACGAQLKGAAQAPWPGEPSAPLVPLSAPVGVSGVTLPEPAAKDTPDFSGLAPIFDKAELASMKAAAAHASLVDSVGVPVCPCCGLPEGMLACNCSHDSKRLAASHATNLAKIKALEEALKLAEPYVSTFNASLFNREQQERASKEVRAALALPSA